jgi:amino acid adenylation domain-containing protein
MHAYLLHQLLDATAERHPRRAAVVQGERVITFEELARDSRRVAAVLFDLGVRAGDRVGILAGKSIETVVTLYGVLEAGASYVPLDPQAPPARHAQILGGCDVSVLVATPSLAAQLLSSPEASAAVKSVLLIGERPAGELPCRTVPWNDVGSAPEARAVAISDTRPAYILHTSGSTGVPKGVTISHSNALAFVHMAAEFFEISPDDRLAAHAPFNFDLSVFDLFTAARNGAAVVLVPESLGTFPARLAHFIEAARITVWNSVASAVALLADRGNLRARSFDALRLVIFSGSVLPVKHLRVARESMSRAVFYNVYGQTEANTSTYYRVQEVPADECWKIPIGRAFPNFEVFALDDRGERVSRPGDVGELYVCGSTVALGYWRDPAKTAASFVDNPLVPWPGKAYRTGDQVTVDERGELLFVGRRDRQVKSRGYRIQMDEIDLVLNNHPAVREGAAVDVPDELLGARIVGFVRRAGELSAADLVDFCSRSLPPYMVPEAIEFLEELPRTGTGKIDRSALRAMRAGAA